MEFGDNIITDFNNLDGKKGKTIITTSFSKDFLELRILLKKEKEC